MEGRRGRGDAAAGFPAAPHVTRCALYVETRCALFALFAICCVFGVRMCVCVCVGGRGGFMTSGILRHNNSFFFFLNWNTDKKNYKSKTKKKHQRLQQKANTYEMTLREDYSFSRWL